MAPSSLVALLLVSSRSGSIPSRLWLGIKNEFRRTIRWGVFLFLLLGLLVVILVLVAVVVLTVRQSLQCGASSPSCDHSKDTKGTTWVNEQEFMLISFVMMSPAIVAVVESRNGGLVKQVPLLWWM